MKVSLLHDSSVADARVSIVALGQPRIYVYASLYPNHPSGGFIYPWPLYEIPDAYEEKVKSQFPHYYITNNISV